MKTSPYWSPIPPQMIEPEVVSPVGAGMRQGEVERDIADLSVAHDI